MGSPAEEHPEFRQRFEPFALRISPSLLRSAYLLTGDRGHAEDLLQATLLRVARHWGEIEHSAEAYAQQVLINLSRDRWRSRRRRVLEVPRAEPPDGSASDSAEQSLDRAELAWAVRSLPRRQREVIVLRFFLDHSVAQTASLVGSSEGTVKSHTDRALRRLRELLGDSNDPAVLTREVPDAH